MDKPALSSDFIKAVNNVKDVVGKKNIGDDEIVYLLANEIAHSFTRDEINQSEKRT